MKFTYQSKAQEFWDSSSSFSYYVFKGTSCIGIVERYSPKYWVPRQRDPCPIFKTRKAASEFLYKKFMSR